MERRASRQRSAGAVRRRVWLVSLAVTIAALQAGCGGGGGGNGGEAGGMSNAAAGASAASTSTVVSPPTTLKAPGDGAGWDSSYVDIAYLLAQGTWKLPTGTRPDFGFDSAGNVVAVWQFNCRVWAGRMDAATGTWHGIRVIDDGPDERWEPTATCSTAEPVVDVRPDGRAVAVWARFATADGTGPAQLKAARFDGNAWAAESFADFSPTPPQDVWGLAIATDGSGQSTVVFLARNTDVSHPLGKAVYYAVSRGTGWAGPQFASVGPLPRDGAYAPSLLAGPDGTLHMTVHYFAGSSPSDRAYYTQYRRKSSDVSSWSIQPAVIEPSSAYGTQGAQIGVSSSGAASVAHTSVSQDGVTGVMRYGTFLTNTNTAGIVQPVVSTLLYRQDVAPVYRYLVSPQSGGQWLLSYGSNGDAQATLEARHRAAEGADWSITGLTTAGPGVSDLQAAVDLADNVTVTYVSGFTAGGAGEVHSRRWDAATSSWSADQIIWPGASDCTRGSHRLKADPVGRVVLMCGVAFYSGEGIGYTARSRRFEP